ncbi:MAG: tetratricopeptide repeat protein, partial [Pseudomonas sp.]|nr:tetratricopeptide repeat protein [Pseudomonas sp.]
GADHPLVGDTDRVLGEVLAARGQHEAARARLERAVELTRRGYGPDHAAARSAELALAVHLHQAGDAGAAARLRALANRPAGSAAQRVVQWRARAYAALSECDGVDGGAGAEQLDRLLDVVARAQPDGGVLNREIGGLRERCR